MAHNQRDNSSFRPNNSGTGNHWQPRFDSNQRTCRDVTQREEPIGGVGNARGNHSLLVVNDQMSLRQSYDSYSGTRSGNYGFGSKPYFARTEQGRVESIVGISASDFAEARRQRTEEHLTRENGILREQLLHIKSEHEKVKELGERVKAIHARLVENLRAQRQKNQELRDQLDQVEAETGPYRARWSNVPL